MQTLQPNLPTTTDKLTLPNNKQRTSSYSWRLLRQSIIERDKYTCQSCGNISTALDVDHIDTNNTNNDPANLQTLCRPCHLLKTTNENRQLDSYQQHSERLAALLKDKISGVTKYK